MMLIFITHETYKVPHIWFILLNLSSASPGDSKMSQTDSAFEEFTAWLEDLEIKWVFFSFGFLFNRTDNDLKHWYSLIISLLSLLVPIANKNLNTYEV